LVSSNPADLIKDRFQRAGRILVVSHIRPDGDAVGSVIGLGLALLEINKHVQMVIADGVPLSLRHLTGSELVRNTPDGAFDLIVSLDCSDLGRVGNVLEGYGSPDINIDHHITNQNYADVNFIDGEAVSTTEIIYYHLEEWALPLTRSVADALLTGLITDTIGFRTANITPKALRMAADLLESGSDLSNLYQLSLVNRSYEAMRFWAAGLSVLERDGSIIWTTLTMADRKGAGYSGRDDADLINLLSAINGVEVCMVFVEQPNGNVKVSWRSLPGIDVSQVATYFGGGGHPAAAGAEISGDLDTVRSQVLQETFRLIRDNHKQYQMDGIKK
jgi:bifunctional oligoribonuclease and PAP phosphatase NrnA